MNNENFPEKIDDAVDAVADKIDDVISGDIGREKPKMTIGGVWKTSKLVVFFLLIIAVLGLVIYINAINAKHAKEIEDTYKKAFEEAQKQETIDISPDISINKATIMESLKVCAELSTVKYEYANIGDHSKDIKLFDKIKIPFTTEQVVYAYKGSIAVGIKDISKSVVEVDDNNKVVKIILPSLEILNHIIKDDDFKTYDVKKSVFTEMNLDDYNDFIKALKESQENALMLDGEFWEMAKETTISTIEKIMSIYELPDGYRFEISFK